MNTLRFLIPLRTFVVAAAVIVLFAVSAVPASAHASLLSSNPADGETLEDAPEQLVLEFSEELDLPSTQVALVTPDGGTVELPPLSVDGNLLIQDVAFPEPGTYTFSFRIVSADGHPVENSIEFTVNSVPEGQEPVVTQTDDASTPDDSASDSDSGVGWGTVGLIAVGALVVVGGAVFLVTRRSRRRA